MRLPLRFIFICLLSSLVVGCVAPQPRLNTASGKPEILIPGTSKKQVIDKIVSDKLEKGMQIKSVTDYGVVATMKVEGSPMASFVYGSRYDSTPEVRITYSVVDSGYFVKVFSRVEMITNPGSGYERASDLTDSYGAQMQSELEGLKSVF